MNLHPRTALTAHIGDPVARELRRPPLETLGLLRRVFTFARPHAKLRNWLLFFVVLRSIQLPLLTWALAACISGPIAAGNVPGVIAAVAGFAVFALFTQVSMYFRSRLALELGEAVIHDLRNQVFAHVLELRSRFFDRTKVGSIIGRLTSDLDSIRTGIQEIVFVSMVQCGQMIISAMLMIWYDWVLFLIVLGIAPVIWIINGIFKRRVTQQQRQAQESFSRVTATLAESVNGIRVTQGYAREEVNAEFFRALITDHSRYNAGAGRTAAIFMPLLAFNSQVFVALLVVVGGYRVLTPEIGKPIGDIIQFFFLANLFFEPVRTLARQYNNALVAMVGAERVFRLLDRKPDWEEPVEPVRIREIDGKIRFRDVTFGYEPDKPVLKEVDFEASPGETIALVGHTGSGKSSITQLIAKMYLVQHGSVEIDGIDVKRLHSDDLHRHMGIVHQDSFLFVGSVIDNIRFALPDAPIQRVVEILNQLGCLDMIESLPAGLHTEVGEAGRNLSVGQRQIISFARAMILNPKILILDEATSAVDLRTEARLQSALDVLRGGRTSVVVAHRLSTIQSADLILLLKDGEIVERGRHAELISQGGIYAKLHAEFSRSLGES